MRETIDKDEASKNLRQIQFSKDKEINSLGKLNLSNVLPGSSVKSVLVTAQFADIYYEPTGQLEITQSELQQMLQDDVKLEGCI